MDTTLKIYVRIGCTGCAEAELTANHIEETYPHISVEVVDIDDPHTTVPDAVFATPTYMLNNRVVSLGNPDISDIEMWLSE